MVEGEVAHSKDHLAASTRESRDCDGLFWYVVRMKVFRKREDTEKGHVKEDSTHLARGGKGVHGEGSMREITHSSRNAPSRRHSEGQEGAHQSRFPSGKRLTLGK